jgi:hypothetical protein
MPRRAGDKGKLVPLNMKVPPKLRAELEKAAKKSGRSLSGETAYSLERRFDYERLTSGEREAAVALRVLSSLQLAVTPEEKQRIEEQILIVTANPTDRDRRPLLPRRAGVER